MMCRIIHHYDMFKCPRCGREENGEVIGRSGHDKCSCGELMADYDRLTPEHLWGSVYSLCKALGIELRRDGDYRFQFEKDGRVSRWACVMDFRLVSDMQSTLVEMVQEVLK